VHDLTAAASTPAELYRAASRGAARPGYDGVSIGIHVPVKQLTEGPELDTAPTRNAVLGSVRCLHTRVRPARRPLAHPPAHHRHPQDRRHRRAAPVLTHFEYGYIK
jgi:hypothetical protein